MCEFISWIEKGGQLYHLTYRDIYYTRRGKELRDFCKDKDDYIGHGAIRYFYDNFVGGIQRECTDFSTPNNFPSEIVADIKAGKFRGLRTPEGLLAKPLYDKYEADIKPLYDKYQADIKPLYDKYQAGRKPLDDKYQAGRKTLDDKYQADRNNIFWNLFKIKKNRNPLWR